MKRIFFTGCCLLAALLSHAQDARPQTLDSCYAMARRYYPAIKQQNLIEQSAAYNVSNASKGYLPQLSVNGQATYQSDVTAVPIKLPNISVPVPDKDQYKIYAELNQPLTDLTVIHTQQEMYRSNAAVETQKVEVDLYKLHDRVNQVFFGILLIDAQLKQTEILRSDLEAGLAKLNAAVTNGTALRSSVDELKAEQVKNDQRVIELKASRKAYAEMLGLLTNQSLSENVVLSAPAAKPVSTAINRPEIQLYGMQKKTFDYQDRLLNAKLWPRASLFFQYGYARPGLNLFDTNFDTYYITGVRLSWSLSSFYTLKKDRLLLDVNRQLIDAQQETFLLNTNLSLKQQNGEIEKLQALIEKDNDLITLRTNVKNSASAQLSNGTITTSDYLRQVNAEDQARQSLVQHQVQLLLAQHTYQTISGN